MSDLEEQVLKESSRRMQESVDWEILVGVMEAIGWTRVEMLASSQEASLEMKIWVKDNLTGNVKIRNDTYVFEDAQDAVLFKLKWS